MALNNLTSLKRKRKTVRGNVTRFTSQLTDQLNVDSEDIEYTSIRLVEYLNEMKELDNEIHDLLSDEEYEADIASCTKYIDDAKLCIFKAQKSLKTKTNDISMEVANVQPAEIPCSISQPVYQTVKLPTIKLESFRGNIEEWQCFWEQFKSSIDQNPNLSPIDKHTFLRGYIEDEPKRLVDGISITAENYETVKNILIAKYGDKNRIIQAHLDFLENIPPIKNPTPTALNETFIECNRRLQALKALGEEISAYGRILVPKVLRAFPEDECRRWIIFAKHNEISESDISKLMKFLSDEVEGALTALKIRGDLTAHEYSYLPATAAFNVNSKPRSKGKNKSPFCPFCNIAGHWPQNCLTVTDVDIRIQKLKDTNRCFLCTSRGHNVKNCVRKDKFSCSKCKKKHHVSICKMSTETQENTVTSINQIDIFAPNYSHLQTARVFITGPTGITRQTRCIFDAGSQSSFIHSNLVDLLQLKVLSSETLEVRAFESSSTCMQPRRKVEFQLTSICDQTTIKLNAFESFNTYAPHPTCPSDNDFSLRTRKMKLADPQNTKDLPIEILIGADLYWKIVKSEAPVRLSDSFVLIPSKFGWIVSGNRALTCVQRPTTSSVNFVNTEISYLNLDENVRSFWDLETLGINATQDRKMSNHDSDTLKWFNDSYKIIENRRVVKLPWKPSIDLSSDNYNVALNRINSLGKKLKVNPNLEKNYIEQMQEYINNNHVELAENKPPHESKVYYLPHHMVRKQKNEEIKWRIVFDASSHSPGKPSLNEALDPGPNMLPEILAILLRFRVSKQAIICDGSRAFLQLSLQEEDRDATRFLWWKTTEEDGVRHLTDEILTYRFSRLPFGLTSSPFLLSATIRELASMHLETHLTAAKLLDKNTFMDDFVISVEDESKALALFYEMQDLMSLISLPLAKWATNSQVLKTTWTQENIKFKEETQVLGVNWNTQTDTFSMDVKGSEYQLSEETTKRSLLASISSFYDPLGLFAPVLVMGKILFQDTWLSGVKWDEILPLVIAEKWHYWISELPSLKNISLERWVGISPTSEATIHVFCDASERAYGAALYIRYVQDNTVMVRLVCSRNRLCPIKKITLPRLELLAALVGARLLQYFCTETNLKSSLATLWSDATVALAWIRGDPNRWKTFVCNRTTEIQQYTSPAQWRHCPGSQNPADYLSRGVSPDELSALNQWWEGPEWLKQHESTWPINPSSDDNCLSTVAESRKQPHVDVVVANAINVLEANSVQPIIEISKFSSYMKLVRITAWIFRFLRNCRSKQRLYSDLTADEIVKAKEYWILTVQRQCFPEEIKAIQNEMPLPTKSKIARFNPFMQDNLLRLGGRLQFANVPCDTKHPILLDGTHPFVKLLIQYTHVRLHHLGVRIVLSELRTSFWILRGRQAIKQVIHQCLPCKLSRSKFGNQIEAPLPTDRITPCKPFTITGIDFAGPVYVRNEKSVKTAYVALFTCSTTRALHIELVSDLSTDKFLMAFQRFVGRRGLPHTIYTDNAQTFQAANRELISLWSTLSSMKVQQFYSENGIKWKFIVPRAAWWGGWWERLVGLTKQCLRKSLGRASLDEESLSTVLIGVEAALNSRPLVYEEGELDDEEALTPGHFLIGHKLTAIPTCNEKNQRLARLYKQQQDLLDKFWRRWCKEYLLQLRTFHQVRNPGKYPRVRVGDLVLLQEDVRPRHLWRKARIESLIPGRDGKVRSCAMKINGRKITRPVQLVIPLEIDQGGEDVAADTI